MCLLYGIHNLKQLFLFIGTQSTILQFWTPGSLRGYGCGTPNGSLWTIGVLIQFYLVVWFIRKRLHNKKQFYWCSVWILSVFLGMISRILQNTVPQIVIKLYGQTVFPYLYLFLAGAFLAEFSKEILSYIAKYWYAFILISVILYISKFDIPFTSYSVLKSIIGVYGMIGFVYSFPRLNIKTDISYGLYIYHMTVVNAMITLGFTKQIQYLFIAVIVSIIFAWISTKTVGSWTSRQKRKMLEIKNG